MGRIIVNSQKYLQACKHIAEGDSVLVACTAVGVSDKSFYAALVRDDIPNLNEEYSRARKARANARFEEIDEIKRRTMLRKDHPEYLDPQAANVVINAIKWQAGKENQGLFGDHVTHEIKDSKPQLSREEILLQLRESGLRVSDVFQTLTKGAESAGETIELAALPEPVDLGSNEGESDDDLSGLDSQ